MCSRVLFQALFLTMVAYDTDKDDILSFADYVNKDVRMIVSKIVPMDALQPKNCAPDDIHYYLFTKNKPTNYEKIYSYNPHQFNSDSYIAFFIHGWSSNKSNGWYQLLKDTFLNRTKRYCVIQVEYYSKYSQLDYRSAVHSSKSVGELIGEFIVNLITHRGVLIKNVLLIGHSTGGHVAGFAGKKVQQVMNKKLPRIIAADPAGPFFETKPETERLSPHDAEVVHVIHTDGNIFGMLKACGTIDFFPNGGSQQKGCLKSAFTSWHGLISAVKCDHQRSWKYLIEGLTFQNKFFSRKCSTYEQYKYNRDLCSEETASLGDLELTSTGNFYLETNSESPYSN